MRLKTIKLAGFKSFVDPTSVNMPSNMCAVVGPNGCGKSNIIDAVRWVMGESSAKNLRGEAMTDVIFNGSGSRKPVGQASIELVFDNSDGTITGEYAGYSEVSVKRRVTRDGQNLYYLNANRCRRRDITDLFLGTGLGPRSYAIIEQGMISRLIEAKPEDLRVYIEEAAGISKYKERRRDTENRMRRTHENLERLTDLREELERQLSRLERQAKAAEKYAVFKEEERLSNAKLSAIRYQVLNEGAANLKQSISEAELAVEAAVTQRGKFDLAIEKHRTEFSERSDAFNDIQGQYYSHGADIARVEQSIKHAQERERSLRIDLEQAERDHREAEEHRALDSAKIEGWEAELLEISPELELLEQTLETSRERLAESEDAMQQWQQNWDQFNQRAAEPKQAAEVQQSRIQYLEQVQTRLLQRKEKISNDVGDIDVDSESEEIAINEETLAEIELSVDTQNTLIAEKSEQISELREKHVVDSAKLDEEQTALQEQKGRLASLEALQSAALGRENESAGDAWLEAQGVNPEQRLADQLEVEPGWERAAELVLGGALQAVCTAKPIADFIGDLVELESNVQIVSEASASAAADIPGNPGGLLSAKIKSKFKLPPVLFSVLTAEDLTHAQGLLPGLDSAQSIVTKDGYWLAADWLRVSQQSDLEAGVIARRKEIEELKQRIDRSQECVSSMAQALTNINNTLKDAESQREAARKAQEERRREANELRSKLNNEKNKIAQLLQKKERAQQDIREIDQQMLAEAENLAEARALLEDAIAAMEKDSVEREDLLTNRDVLRATLDDARQKARHAQDKNHEFAMRHRSIQTQLESMRQGIQRLAEQISRLAERRDQLRAALEDNVSPVEDQQVELEALLEKRMAVEQKLAAARKTVEETETALREAEQSRDRVEKDLSEQRSKLEAARLELQTLNVNAQNIKQQLVDDDLELERVLEELIPEDSEAALEASLEQLANRISRLGPINLAAIDEYKVESERKLYLDEQNDDLCEALETLEAAIRKIDKETRTRFKETFDQVNSGLQDLFPRLFGGGHAYLELTGEDMLDTGIAIMARPPGKKNSTIHLLSGGEKALTAIALVFSIFQLNPAPFCMLDEVDAPLDDANVGRYVSMVEAMSEKVQFIYITHNKIAMEKALHLMGVTMQEAGVSRMVTVDVEEAAELAAV